MTMEKALKQMLKVAMKKSPSSTGFNASSIAFIKLESDIVT
jgi:hypothetical protein